MIQNPVLRGFHPDPCVCRRGEDYYLAVSTFEWCPGIPVYHSRDLKHWELYTHILTDDTKPDLRSLPASKGVWAPSLTWCEEDQLFYVVYGVMLSTNARYFDVDNYLITARDIRGPWSEPVYLHSAGFDASMFHDRDGRKWIVSLEWETRYGYEKPGDICLAEYDPGTRRIVDYPRRIWRGATDRGCIEGPCLTRRNGWYYLMCAEGGTGYYHCVTMARSKNIAGPYEADPAGPILTAQPMENRERRDTDHLKARYYNPDSPLQKTGHGSYVDLPTGETYLFHLCARPFVPELRCTLGRETAVQKMKWTEDGWLRMEEGGPLPRLEVPESALPPCPLPQIPETDHFDGEVLGIQYYAPRTNPRRFTDLISRPGWVRVQGQESPTSTHQVSLLARKLTSVRATISTRMEFHPEIYQHSAGLVLYYDNMNYLYLRKYWSETLNGPALAILRLENGVRTTYINTRTPVADVPLRLRLRIQDRCCRFEWSADGEPYRSIGPSFDTSCFSDEYSTCGEFTGTMVGLLCVDSMFHRHTADFDYFQYQTDEEDSKMKGVCQ